MIFNLNNPYEKERCKKYCESIFEKGGIVEVVRKNKNRTLKQNNYLHLILSFFATELGYSVEEVKIDYFKRLCNKDIFERSKLNKQGNEINYLRSTSELDTKELSLAIERFRNWSSSVAEIYLPSANEKEYLIYVQQEIYRHKEYL